MVWGYIQYGGAREIRFGGGKIMVWGYIQYGGAREICKVDGNIDSAKYQQILASQYIPTTRGVRWRGQIFNRIELLAIPQVPLWSSTGGRRSRSFRDGQHSLQILILLSISGEEWRRKLGGPSRRTWRSFGILARWPSMPSPTTSSTSSMALSQTGWQLFCRPKEQYIHYF